MNDRQRRILAQQIGEALSQRRRVISVPLASALLEIEAAHLERLEREGLFPSQVRSADGSREYRLDEIYEWLKDF
jgi:hypothetical protein